MNPGNGICQGGTSMGMITCPVREIKIRNQKMSAGGSAGEMNKVLLSGLGGNYKT